jgi:glucose repression mediator protein
MRSHRRMNRRGSLSVCHFSYPKILLTSFLGAVSEQLNDTDRANSAYENALRHNPLSVSALTQVAGIARVKEDFHKVSSSRNLLGALLICPQAVDYYQRVLNISQENGEVWGSLGHCYLMMDDLQKAYTAYQQALYRLPNPKVCSQEYLELPKLTGRQDPKLWYGIGILYDRYGSLEHAEEAFSSVLRMEPSKSQLTHLDVRLPLSDFDKANEVYFRLGIIYKTQQKFKASLEVSTIPASKGPR